MNGKLHAHPFRHRDLGARRNRDGVAHIRVWCPTAKRVAVEIKHSVDAAVSSVEMSAGLNGYFSVEIHDVPAGSLYQFRLDDAEGRPDPVSRFQPDGVHGWSQIGERQFDGWTDHAWKGIDQSDLIIYELHLGAFTHEGTYLAAIERIGELVDLGITAIELMPVSQSAGRWNWGYDGVDFFAPHSAFGTPEEFKQFVNAAHVAGLAVLHDVVYNHFGPEGNYLSDFASYISPKHKTPWGDAFNLDIEEMDGDVETSPEPTRPVRDFLISNATYWIEEFHLDGLRLDAIHCLADDSDEHVIAEISRAFHDLGNSLGRKLHLIAESNVYDSQMLAPPSNGGYAFDALWCDDFLHSVFAVLRPGENMSDRQYTADDLNVVLNRGYVYEGSITKHRERFSLEQQPDSARLNSLIIAIQHHDFIGNHPTGCRLHQICSSDAQRAAAALMLLFPAIPMLFMGEEFATEHPFHFFADFGDPSIRASLEDGRRREYPQHDWSDGKSPLAESAFLDSKIGDAQAGNADTRAWYQQLIEIRKSLQARSLFCQENLTAEWDTDRNLGMLTYRSVGSDPHTVSVYVRLHPVDESASPVSIEWSENHHLRLSQSCQQNATTVTLNNYGVAVIES
jgi:malto-oligosyltrehalose trehalohydrolase